jgi:hypothetical protein
LKKRFNLIVLFMSVSLAGIIFTQALWIRHAMKMEASRFEKSAHEAMLESIDNWGRFDRFSFINNKINLPPPPVRPVKPTRKYYSVVPGPNSQVSVVTDTVVDRYNRTSHIISITSNNKVSARTRIREDSLYNNSQSDYNLEWIPDTDSNIDWVTDEDQETFELREMNDSIRHKLEELHIRAEEEKAKVIEEKLEQFNKNMEEWVVEYSFDPNKMFGRFPVSNLDTLLRNALFSRGIDLPFYYQVVQEAGDSLNIISATKDASTQLKNAYKANLFPDDFFRKNMFLLLSFPSKNSYIFKSLTLLITGSVVFTLIILTTFWFTIFYMLKQKKMSQIKTDFINNMTHEFKTPIATIGLATDALSSPKVFGQTDPTKYYLGIIRQENKRMNSQVEKVLQMALIERGNIQIEPQPMSVHEVIEHTIEVLQLSAQQKNGRITSVLRASCDELLADEVHFTNLMNNLLDNAIKYTERPPEIVIETYNQQNTLVIRIADNGVGMTKEVQQHIFDQFYRRPSGNIHNVKGFGLGLSYVKAIVTAHGGTIHVHSEPGNGSIFTMTLNCHKS